MEKTGTIKINRSSLLVYSGNNTEYIPDVVTVVPQPQLDGMLSVRSSTEGYILVRVKKDDMNPKVAFATKGGRTETIANGVWCSLSN